MTGSAPGYGALSAGQRQLAWLVLRAQAGDRPALEELLRHTQRLLAPYVRAMVRDADRASHVMQEVLLIVYRKLDQLREPRVFASWARRIATREVIRASRQQRGREVYLDEVPDIVAETGEDPALEEIRELLPGLLHRISPASRSVIVLHYMEGLTIEETAAILDISIGTAKSRLSYGLRALREALRGSGS